MKFDTPAGQTRAYALFAHCFTCSKESKAAAFVSQALAGCGIATLRFDFSGLEFTSARSALMRLALRGTVGRNVDGRYALGNSCHLAHRNGRA